MANRSGRGRGMIVFDGITPIVTLMEIHTAQNVYEAMQQGAFEVETYARANAPWSDITGMARTGLTSSVYMDGGEVILELAHSVEYGEWLELIQDGNFAIIMPTLEALAPAIMRDAGARALSTGGGS